MSITLVTPGMSDWSWAPYDVRVKDGLIGAYIFGKTLDQSRRNHAPGGLMLDVVGAPTILANAVRLTGNSAYFQMQVTDREKFTYLTVSRTLATPTGLADSVCFVGNYAGAGLTQLGATLYTNSNASHRVNLALNNGGAVAGTSAILNHDVTTARLIVADFDGAAAHIYDATAGTSDSNAAAYPRAASTANKLRIGSAHISMGGTGEFYVTFVWAKALSTDERNAMIADIRTLMATRGVTV